MSESRNVSFAAVLLGALLATFGTAHAAVLFQEDFSDATGTAWLDLGSGNTSEKYQPTYYFSDPADPQWVFFDGTFLASSEKTPANTAAGDKGVLLNESPDHALALRQSIAVAPGTPLNLTFNHWGDNRPDTTDYRFEVRANQTVIGVVDRNYTIPGPGALASFNFLAPANGQLLLSFRDVSAGQASAIIDNIVLTAIPEPETYALIASGLGFLGWIARRRTARR
jgi:hypothetical protein